ncbi:uncharacterized protein LOC122948769 isoform X4 [Acropora millepora]|uniref:uncharacterized protein LOC122948769 isoform X4 n=2 Tax=Acropora millepora TaxID=45264 RepID=UPI001CF56043|nr:uncharacterized protein LOC122948769 isoform X4 [Acropora millepora]
MTICMILYTHHQVTEIMQDLPSKPTQERIKNCSIMIQPFKFLPRSILMSLFLARIDTSFSADQSFHSYSRFLLMSSFNPPSRGLPAGLAEVEMIERARAKREFLPVV